MLRMRFDQRTTATVVALVFVLAPNRPATAQQSVTVSAGHFSVRGADARIDHDVVLENMNLFAVDLSDFNSGTFGGSWNVAIGEYLETSLGLGYFRRTVPSVYDEFVNADGSEIFQEFALQVVPFTATLQVFPFGLSAAFQPYFGGGFGLYRWRYSEVGDFIDFTDFSVFRDRYVADGSDVGSVLLGGVRVPVGDRYSVGAEVRYQEANGFVGVENGFLEDLIDLGGVTGQVILQVKF